jgi:hypothetical protein
MLVRLRARQPELAGWLWAFLDSDAGYTLLRRLPYGGSIPHLDEAITRSVLIPLTDDADMRRLSVDVLGALEQRDQALAMERRARLLVECAIEGSA